MCGKIENESKELVESGIIKSAGQSYLVRYKNKTEYDVLEDTFLHNIEFIDKDSSEMVAFFIDGWSENSVKLFLEKHPDAKFPVFVFVTELETIVFNTNYSEIYSNPAYLFSTNQLL